MKLIGETFKVHVQDAQHILSFDVLVPIANLEQRWNMKITKHGTDWLLQKDGVSLLSPTPLFYHIGLNDFTHKFERHFQINRGDTCLDVGACIGDTTVPMALKTNGTIYAVEPEPTNLHYLTHNVKPFPHVQIIPKAAFNTTGTLPLHSQGFVSDPSLLHKPAASRTVMVETDTLDNLLGNTCIDYAKIDVQNAEPEVLEGASQLLSTVKKLVIFIHNRATPRSTLPRIQAILNAYDFTIQYCRDIGVLYASR